MTCARIRNIADRFAIAWRRRAIGQAGENAVAVNQPLRGTQQGRRRQRRGQIERQRRARRARGEIDADRMETVDVRCGIADRRIVRNRIRTAVRNGQ